MTEAINEAAQWRNAETLKKEAEYKKMFEQKGVTIIKPDRAEFAAACSGLVDKFFPALIPWANEIKAIK